MASKANENFALDFAADVESQFAAEITQTDDRSNLVDASVAEAAPDTGRQTDGTDGSKQTQHAKQAAFARRLLSMKIANSIHDAMNFFTYAVRVQE